MPSVDWRSTKYFCACPIILPTTITEIGTTTNDIKESGTEIVNIITITPTSVVILSDTSAISCDIDVAITSISLVIRERVSPYWCLSKYEIGKREILSTI